MKKLLLFMLIAIVVISCKKEEKSKVIPVGIEPNYIKIDKLLFPTGKATANTFIVCDDNVMNLDYGSIYNENILLTSNATDSTVNIKLPRRFYISGDSLRKDVDSVYMINTNQFIIEGRDTIFKMGAYTIYKPFNVGSSTRKCVNIVYKSTGLEYYRTIHGSLIEI